MKWFLGATLLLLAALVLESGTLAYAMYVLLGLLLVSRGLARSWVVNLEATRQIAPADGGERPPGDLTAEIGDKVSVHLTIHNRGLLPVPWVLLEDLLPKASLDKRFPR